jgi:hypothetical protein
MDYKKPSPPTLLERISQVLKSGVFVPPPEIVIKKNETPIGELDDLEKAVLTVIDDVVNENNAMVNKCAQAGRQVSEKILKKNRKDFEDLNEYFWKHIKRRIGKPANRLNGTAIRAGYKVVAFSDPHEEVIICKLRGAMGHDCVKCKIYDACELLQKKPRKKDEDQE